ncbi:hypothetical protein N7468_006741 [Penicillium chermesinum]|uniref:Uncharacterized protein n=1 Tax=Penicillium chermesinum TaxID=63820 RepID=A0A9W9TJW6_9EURO|nr:uncharacterized protein N7468_006741 [Penicillium chermesinum]KAJ5225516.1 hypothetical protein N7468_006741 [Penicillium chermesinum]
MGILLKDLIGAVPRPWGQNKLWQPTTEESEGPSSRGSVEFRSGAKDPDETTVLAGMISRQGNAALNVGHGDYCTSHGNFALMG